MADIDGDKNSNKNKKSNEKKTSELHIVFIHLDLGIGGAESLILHLATASQDLSHRVDVVTTRCDQDHCFDGFKKPTGRLSNNVRILGNWIPATIPGVGLQALLSNIRMIYLAVMGIAFNSQLQKADLVVVDVLPISIPFLRLFTSFQGAVMFYCHFPDKLLVRTNNPSGNTNTNSGTGGTLQRYYRQFLNILEDSTMPLADLLVVNSEFTKSTVKRVFPSLAAITNQQNNDVDDLHVLYPTLDTSDDNVVEDHTDKLKSPPLIVSLNRYERKKNIELLLYAYVELLQQQQHSSLSGGSLDARIVIAGGYDTKVAENVEYRAELQKIVSELKLTSKNNKNIVVDITFLANVSDQERSRLLREALCVVYTPSEEHFGIVPLEAMHAGACVIAVNSGGPKETVVHGETGYLCEPTPTAFANALRSVLENPAHAQQMGKAGKKRVLERFGKDRLREEWETLIWEAVKRGTLRRRRQQDGGPIDSFSIIRNVFLYITEGLLILVFCICLTWCLRRVGILDDTESIIGALQRKVTSDEL